MPAPLFPEFPIPDWAKELPAAITVCDQDAIIIYMNDRASATFNKDNGEGLIGKSLYDCHSEYSSTIIRDLLSTGRNNIYTIEKKGVRKMICQLPWCMEGVVAGLVEISIVLPEEVPHFIRQ